MRLALGLLPPLLLALPFACGTTSASSGDAGPDATVPPIDDATDEFNLDSPVIEAGIASHCTTNDADPVGLCVQKAALQDLHAHAFAAGKGVTASWSSATEAPDPNDAGLVTYSLDETAAYAAAIARYFASASVYGDTSINAALQADLQAIALQLETGFAVPPAEYSGELYFHLRGAANGFREVEQNSDATKFDAFADAYGRAIYTAHYFPLPLATTDAGTDAGGAAPHDASHDAELSDSGLDTGPDSTVDASLLDGGGTHVGGAHDGATPAPDARVGDSGAGPVDGILGNPAGATGIAYAPGDVATAAYALLDLVNRHRMDPDVAGWLGAARASLEHLQRHAQEPTTRLFYTSLLASRNGSGSGPDPLGASANPALPSDALLTDTQATFALAMVRAQSLVTANTVVTILGGGSTGPVEDGGVTGPFLPVLDLPLEAWADAAVGALNGVPGLWDGPPVDAGLAGVDAGFGAGAGFMDGYIVSTQALVTTKSTRANAFMAAALTGARANGDFVAYGELAPLVRLLTVEPSFAVPLGSNLITVLPAQTAFLRGATRAFLPLEAGANPTSYTSAATSAVVEALNEDFPPMVP